MDRIDSRQQPNADGAHIHEAGDVEAPTERTPLIGGGGGVQGPCPVCTRWLLEVSYRNLFTILFALFVSQLGVNHELNDWGKTLVTTLVADFLYVFICVLGVINVVISIHAPRPEDLCGWLSGTFWLLISATLFWYSLIRISDLHGLEVLCLRKHGACPESDDGSIWAFGMSWLLMPLGALHCLAGVLWRPFYLLLYFMTFCNIDSAPHSDSYEWREITIGLSGWMYAYVGWLFVRSLPREEAAQPEIIALFFLGALFVLGMTFYMTSEPMAWMYSFLMRPWRVLFNAAFHGRPLELTMQEAGAVFLMIWWVLRALLILHIGNLQKWDARKRVEEALHYARTHPFRAELVEGFANALPASDTEGTPPHALVRKFTRVIVGEPLDNLRSKREKLGSARRALFRQQSGSVAALPQMFSFSIRRSHLLEETWRALYDRPVAELLAPDMLVTFEGESGLDAGGVQRDWFDSVARALTEGVLDVGGTSLLTTAPDQTLIPRAMTSEDQHLQLFALGMFIAMAVYREQPLPLSFSQVACKHFLSVAVGMEDVKQLDPDFYRGRVVQVLKQGGLQETEEAIGGKLYFMSAATDLRPEPEELIPGGASKEVTEENKLDYVQLLCEAHLCGGIRNEIQLMLSGFWHVLPQELLKQQQVTPPELSIMISGVKYLDPSEWRQHSEHEPESHLDSEVFDWFWRVVSDDLDSEKRCMLLQFVTGASRLPPGGFACLTPPFRVTLDTSETTADKLPEAHTCLNQIIVRAYPSYETTRDKLTTAIAAEGFSLA